MVGLAATRRGSTDALDEPPTAVLAMPYRCERAFDLQTLALGREYGLRIRASLPDLATLRASGQNVHFVGQNLVVGKRLQKSLNAGTTDDWRLPLVPHGAGQLKHGR